MSIDSIVFTGFNCAIIFLSITGFGLFLFSLVPFIPFFRKGLGIFIFGVGDVEFLVVSLKEDLDKKILKLDGVRDRLNKIFQANSVSYSKMDEVNREHYDCYLEVETAKWKLERAIGVAFLIGKGASIPKNVFYKK